MTPPRSNTGESLGPERGYAAAEQAARDADWHAQNADDFPIQWVAAELRALRLALTSTEPTHVTVQNQVHGVGTQGL